MVDKTVTATLSKTVALHIVNGHHLAGLHLLVKYWIVQVLKNGWRLDKYIYVLNYLFHKDIQRYKITSIMIQGKAAIVLP